MQKRNSSHPSRPKGIRSRCKTSSTGGGRARREIKALDARRLEMRSELSAWQNLRDRGRAFSSTDELTLQRILKDKFERALPGLEEAVRGYLRYRVSQDLSGPDDRTASQLSNTPDRASAEAATELVEALSVFQSVLERVGSQIEDAERRGDFRSASLADLLSPGDALSQGSQRRRLLAAFKSRLVQFGAAAEAWQRAELERGKPRRGRPSKPSRSISGYVGYVLARAGVELGRGASSRWARVTRIVYRTVGLKPPKSIEHLLIKDYAYLAGLIPDTLAHLPLK